MRRIFASILGGMSKSAIARLLNAQGVPSPAAYAGRGHGLWSYSSVDRILRGRVYAGDLVQGVNGNISYKVQKTRRREPAQWFVSENSHEALVSREDFRRAQALMNVHARAEGSGKVHPLAGLVRCADCGRALMRRRVAHAYRTYEYYMCPTYRQSKTACTKHSVRADAVESAVLEAMREEIAAWTDLDAIAARLPSGHETDARRAKALEKKLETVMEHKRGLYSDWKSGELTRQEYLSFKAGYDEREKALRAQIEEQTETERKAPDMEYLRSLAMPEKLERGLVCALINRVSVHEGGDVDVVFTFTRPRAAAPEGGKTGFEGAADGRNGR